MGFTFKKATKLESKGRIALTGPSGSGKTLTALKFARVLAGPTGRIAVIDTEKGSASKYSDKFDFDVLELTSFAPLTYVEAIKAAEAEGYDVIVVDSLTHAWSGKDGAMEQVDKIKARTRGGEGNGFTAWKDVTPMHNALIDAMTGSTAHVVATMRSKMEYVIEEDSRGKKVPRKVGMAPEQRAGMEYEFDLVGDMDQDHRLVVSKSRCDELADAVVMKPGPETAEVFKAWLSGAPRPAAPSNALSESAREAQENPPVPEIPPALAAFHAALPGLASPDAGTGICVTHRAVLAAAAEPDRKAAIGALARRLTKFGGGVATIDAAKGFIKRTLAEHDARVQAEARAQAAASAPVAPPAVAIAPEVAPLAAEAPAPVPAPEPVAAPFGEQLARCTTLDGVAGLWIAAGADIAQGSKADQAAAWGAAVERLAIIQHCEPTKAVAMLLTKRIATLSGDKPDPNGPKGTPSRDATAPVDAHGHGEHANDGAGATMSTAARWRAHLAAKPRTGRMQGAGAVAASWVKHRDELTEAGARAECLAITIDELFARGVTEPGAWIDGVREHRVAKAA